MPTNELVKAFIVAQRWGVELEIAIVPPRANLAPDVVFRMKTAEYESERVVDWDTFAAADADFFHATMGELWLRVTPWEEGVSKTVPAWDLAA